MSANARRDTRLPVQQAPPHKVVQKPPPMPANAAYDFSLQHERSVFQLLKKQYARYTPEMVERITGIPKDQFLKRRTCSRRFAKTAT